MEDRVALYSLSRDQIAALVVDAGEAPYRAEQLWHWMYRRLALDFAEMTSLPARLRERLGNRAVLHTSEPVSTTNATDAMAEKQLIRLADGQLIESVLMHYTDPVDEPAVDDSGVPVDSPPLGRHTVCLSTQAGCAMGCVFCATGQMGLVRDLDRGECVEQVVRFARRLGTAGQRLSNIVFMGMGEPLANWPSTWGTVETLIDGDGLGLSPRRITISTVGLVPGIRRLAQADRHVRLAVSLHAPDDDLRSQLVPINVTYPLREVMSACADYASVTGRRVTYEYVLIRDVNDHVAHARRLAGLLRPVRGHVNLIPLNPTAGSDLRPSTGESVAAFQGTLVRAGVPASVRMRRGIDVQAGCGQLRSRAASGRLGRSVTVGPGSAVAVEPGAGAPVPHRPRATPAARR